MAAASGTDGGIQRQVWFFDRIDHIGNVRSNNSQARRRQRHQQGLNGVFAPLAHCDAFRDEIGAGQVMVLQ